MIILEKFEQFIKKYKSLYFNKLYEKYNEGYKVIYNIQGFNYNNTFYANLKFIFWLNESKSKLEHNALTYLYIQKNNGYASENINEENIEETINEILEKIKNEKTNLEINNFIISGTDEFNLELKRNGINDFIMNLEYIPSGDTSSMFISFDFKLSTNNKEYEFKIKFDKNWFIYYNNNKIKTSFKTIYKDIIKEIYKK